MDINDFFKGFFGFNRMRPDRFEDPFNRNDDDDNENFRNPHISSDPMFDGFPHMFQHMEDMFNNMFSIHSGFLGFPNLEMPHEEQNPRDLMLKSPESCEKDLGLKPSFSENRGQRLDIDLDEKVAEGGLHMLEEENTNNSRYPQQRSVWKSVSTRIIRSGNGIVEEHHSERDSSGKTVTRVRKSLGDKSYQMITETDASGTTERKEDFINMDEKEIDEFQERLKQQKDPFTSSPPDPKYEIISPPPGDPKYSSIFRNFFGF